MRIETDKGDIFIDNEVFTTITGTAAANCFGVKGMSFRSVSDGIVHILKREAVGKGVHISYHGDDEVSIDLHIIIEHGVNISALCRSIIGEVKYIVEKMTGARVRAVNIFIDSMMLD